MFFVFLCFFLSISQVNFASPFGKDADLVNIEMAKRPSTANGMAVALRARKGINSQSVSDAEVIPLRALSRTLICFHQKVVTPIDGPRSHFLPSSSQYTLDGIEKYGFFKGWILGCDRLLRENDDPWIYPTCLNQKGERFKSDPIR